MPNSQKYRRCICLLCGLILLLTGMVPLSPRTAGADTKKIEGTTNVEDTKIYLYNETYNYGAGTVFAVVPTGSFVQRVLIRVKNVASELGVGATNITAVCSAYCYNGAADDNISAYQVFKDWGEGTQNGVTCSGNAASWYDWACPNYEWGTAGCANASDEGEDNSGDGSDYDRKATAEATVNVTEAGWWSWSISTELATGWYNETIGERGIVLVGSITDGANYFWSTEYTTDPTLCPFFVFTYTTDGEPPVGNPRLQRKKRMGGIDEEDIYLARFACPDWLW